MPELPLQDSGGNILDKYTVKLLSRALEDLDKISAYIASNLHEPGTAESMIDALVEGILSLESMPYRFPERRTGSYANRGYRQLMVKNYAVIYRVDEAQKQVIVVTVRYARRQF